MPEAPYVKRLARTVAALGEIPDPLLRLDAIRLARQELEELEAEAVRASRVAGRTWTEIGALYALTKQGAQQRFRRAEQARASRD